MSYSPCTWPPITVSLLVAGVKVTFSPWALNRPSLSATKKPAESRAGTTATFRFGFSTPDEAAAPRPLEHPATSASAAAVTTSALPGTRLGLVALPLPRGAEGADCGRYVPAHSRTCGYQASRSPPPVSPGQHKAIEPAHSGNR